MRETNAWIELLSRLPKAAVLGLALVTMVVLAWIDDWTRYEV